MVPKLSAMPSTWTAVAPGIYRSPNGSLYARPRVKGVRTWRRLAARTIQEARLELAKRTADAGLARLGLAVDPWSRSPISTVSEVLGLYVAAGAPRRSGRPREGRQLFLERNRVSRLNEFFGRRLAIEIDAGDLDRFHAWRIRSIARGPGDRTVDLELATLSSAFRLAVRRGLPRNPLADRRRFTDPEKVRHAREFQPASADELDAIARELLEGRSSAAFAWAVLFQAMTGRRIRELLELRADARAPGEPGFVDRLCLWFRERRSHKGAAGFVRLHPGLRRLLRAWRTWHQETAPESAWFFPSPVDPSRSISPGSLGRALDRVCRRLSIPRRRSHGLRSYFVNVLRSRRVPDSEIALLIGQKSGGRLIVEVYGELRPGRLDWLPRRRPPAWERRPGTIVQVAGGFRASA